MTPEAKVKKKVKEILKLYGAYYAMPIGTGFGNAGVPDFLVCIAGRFVGVECKAGKGKTTALQDKNLEQIKTSGGLAIVVNEDSLGDLEYILNTIIDMSPNAR